MMFKHFAQRSVVHHQLCSQTKRSLLPTGGWQTSALTQLRHFSSQAAYNSKFVDTSKLTNRSNGEMLRREPDRTQFKYAVEIPDYQIDSKLSHKVNVTPEMSR